MMGPMASRAPLLGAAALFLVGAVGLLATFPGRDAVRTFVPLFRSESVSVPSPVSRVSDAAIPEPLFPVETLTAVVEDEAVPTVAVAAAPVVDVEEPMTPAPEIHFAVVTAVASDSEPPAAIGAVRVVMVSSGEDASSSGDATSTSAPEHEPSAGGILPVALVKPASDDRPASEPPADSKTGQAETAIPTAEHASTDGGSKHDDDHPKAEHEPAEKEKPQSKSGSSHD